MRSGASTLCALRVRAAAQELRRSTIHEMGCGPHSNPLRVSYRHGYRLSRMSLEWLSNSRADAPQLCPRGPRAGERAVFDDCRRLFSTPAQRAGVGRETVKDLGGWSSNAVVERRYTGEIQQALERAMDRIAKAQGVS